MIQNADDAGASQISFMLDLQSHSTCYLINTSLKMYQGPALYSWNNSVFTNEDWQSIQEMGQSTKREASVKVGRFGLGFVSVYHITGLQAISKLY